MCDSNAFIYLAPLFRCCMLPTFHRENKFNCLMARVAGKSFSRGREIGDAIFDVPKDLLAPYWPSRPSHGSCPEGTIAAIRAPLDPTARCPRTRIDGPTTLRRRAV